MYQLFDVKISSTNQNESLLLLDDPSRVKFRSQITSGLCPKTLVSCAGFVYRVYLKKKFLTRRILGDRYRGFKRNLNPPVSVLLIFASLPDCSQNQIAVSDTLRLLSDF
jgi:hypothetical protein